MISICIPAYNKFSQTHDSTYNNITMLEQLFASINNQDFMDYETIVSDHSEDDSVEKLCEPWRQSLNIKYYRYCEKKGSCEANLNNAIKKASRKYVKPMLQDDYFNSPHALSTLYRKIEDERGKWVVSGCIHVNENDCVNQFNPIQPRLTDPLSLLIGVNTIGSPIVLMHVNDNTFYDERLIWLMDVEFYYRKYIEYGLPLIVNDPLLVSRLRAAGITNTMITNKIIEEEKMFCLNKIKSKDSMVVDDVGYPEMCARLDKIGILR